MSFKPKVRHMIDSYKGMGRPAMMQERARLLGARSELDRRLSAVNRALAESHRELAGSGRRARTIEQQGQQSGTSGGSEHA